MRPGIPELLIILVIVLLVFGVGRLARVGREAGEAVRNFREGVRDATAPTTTVEDTATPVGTVAASDVVQGDVNHPDPIRRV